MPTSANLALPFIEAAQAQKHVTHNEALRLLDTLVQLAVLDRSISAPPGAPAEGQRWIVAPSPTGAWAGHATHIAAWQDGAWQFTAPRLGFVAFVADEGTLVTWNGAAWGDFFATVSAIQNLALLGVGTTADATNPLSAKLNNALFAAKTVAEGGDGNLRQKLSKESAAKTASLLLQTNASGRAEIGLTGDDDLRLKVSPDGSTWHEAIRLDSASGKVSFPITGGPRELLAADRTYYVRTDGSDANSGLVNNAGGAFLTIQKAIDAASALDLGARAVTIQVGAGTYTGAVTLKNYVGAGPITILGDAATPANVVISPTNVAACFSVFNVASRYILQGMKLQTTTAGHGFNVGGMSCLEFLNMDFGALAAGYTHIVCSQNSFVVATGNYNITGGAAFHTLVMQSSCFRHNGGITVTLSGTPAFSSGFVQCVRGAVFDGAATTYSGSATGKHFDVSGNSVVLSSASATYFPGNATGTCDVSSFITGLPSSVIVDADGRTLTVAESGTRYSNEGAAARADFTLPSAALGLEYSFLVQDSSGLRVIAAAGDTIRIAASVSAAAGRIDSTTIGDAVTLHAINATEWVTGALVGSGWSVT